MEAKGQFVLVEPITNRQEFSKKLSAMGLVAQEKGPEGPPNRGKVLSIGDGIKNPEYAVGDVVIFNEEQPSGFKHEGQDYLPIHQGKIIGILKDDA